MRTHDHGQGHLDLSFVVPELVDSVSFAKYPYCAENIDFATTGAGRLKAMDTL